MKMRLWIIIVFSVIAVVTLATMVFINKNDEEHNHDHSESHGLSLSNEIPAFDWCVEHSVPESGCTQCNSSLIEQFKATGDWCAGHDLPESQCRLCNPGLKFPQELELAKSESELDWCAEHAIPESVCTQCNSALIDKFKETGDWCAGHGLPESHCRLCNPGITFAQEEILKTRLTSETANEIKVSLFFRENTDVCATNDALIQFASSNTAERSGFTFQRAIASSFESTLNAPAEIVFDENSSSVITSSVKVLVSRWLISPGDIVTKGDPIAILQSSEMAELQARLMGAYAELEVQNKELERYQTLISKNLVSRSDYDRTVAQNKKAKAEYISVRGLLLSSGLNNNDIDSLIENSTVANEFILRAPADGVIAQRIAQVGELLEDGQALALLSDPNSLWIEAQLTEDQIKATVLGQNLYFASDEDALNRVKGTIIWISPYLDVHTRTGVVRARVVDNIQVLRAGEFGQVTISETFETESILVPKDAVQWEGCCNVVFVKESNSRFRPRKVHLADGPGSYYQITNGLNSGEDVVVNGSFLLKTELKKTSIGAGCCGIEPVG